MINDGMTQTHWNIMQALADGSLTWGAAVGECWPDLQARGYVEPNWGEITDKGRAALKGGV